jgi:hypothetical protein
MTHHRKQNGSMQLPDPTYQFESNDYSMVAASQPREQLNPSYYQQPYQIHSEKFNYPLNRPVENHQQQTRNGTFSYEQQRGQPSQYYQQENFNDNQRRNFQKCFRCGQIGHIQKYCQQHLN